MIQPQELRIGNLLNHSELGMVEVIGVGKDYIHVIYNGETHYENIRSFSTIPLTEEILLKFGFEDQEFSDEDGNKIYMLHHKKFYLTSDESCMFSEVFLPIYSNDCVSVKYVHQLQNLYFALTGEELTFK